MLLSKKCVKSGGRMIAKQHKTLAYNNILKSLIFLVFAPYCPFGSKNAKYREVACQDYSSSNPMMVYIFSTSDHHFFDSQKGER